jgi:Helitron helicase-like domain at N-terminus
MYLLYDVIQRRKAAVGNSLLVKRKDYGAVQEVMSSLTHDQLITAAQSLRVSQKTSDPAIAILRRSIQTIAGRVPNSFAQKLDMRLHIRALFIEFGPPAFWLTINPSDLRDPLVIKLAGVTLPKNGFEKTTAALRRKTANMNPTAVAVFFHKVCTAVLEALIAPKDDGVMGILGDVSTYFGVVESNGRGMLHMHGFVWLTGNVDFVNLGDKILNDPAFAREMIEYLDSIISECIDLDPSENEGGSDHMSRPSTRDFDSEEDYINAIRSYGNAVASKQQMHSRNHNSTCFKYCRKGTRQCRFDFPRPLYETSHFDDFGVIHLRRTDQWVNPYNCRVELYNT